MPVRLAAAVVAVALTIVPWPDAWAGRPDAWAGRPDTWAGQPDARVATVGAQTSPTVPPSIVEGRPDTECVSAVPRPDCYQSDEFARSSRSHLLLFGLLGLALVGIAAVVVRSTVRNDRARRAAASRS